MAPRSVFLASAILSFITSTNGHMVITHPVPFDQSALNNSPLAADGSDFPCKFGGATGYTDTVTQMNSFQAGSSTNLTFMGSAVHGGGSCQVSYTTDAKPTKDSQWKVLLSVIGGCPSNAPGNLDSDPTHTGTGLNSFEFELPKDLPNGQGTIAWSWLNKLGNREFYMNCAPVTISGGASDASGLSSLPDMFVANLPPDTCALPYGVDFVYPNPGKKVTTAGTTALASTLAVTNGCASVTNMGAGNGKLGSPAKPTGSVASSAGSDTGSATSGGNAGGVFAPGASPTASSSAAATTPAESVMQPPAATTPAKAAPVAAAPTAAPPKSSAPAAAPASSGSGSCASGEVACSTPGFYCISDSQFGMCANGCAVPQAVAAGTVCSGSVIGFASSPRKMRRHIRQHAHKHRRNAYGYKI